LSQHVLDWIRGGAGAEDATALVDGGRRVRYGELWRGVKAVRELVDECAAGRSEAVAVIADNAPETVLIAFGTLASGRAVAEINPQESPERTRRLLASLDPVAVYSDRDLGAALPPGPAVLGPNEVAAAVARGASTPERPPAMRADHLAYVVFTSGTTGDPKGVMLSHGNLTAVMDAILDYLPLSPLDRYALVLPLFHTYGKSVLFTTLRAGGTVVFESDFGHLPRFVHRLSSEGITALSGVPYHVNMLVRRAPLEGHDLSALRLVTISGSHLAPAVLGELRRRLPGVSPWFMYGLTESSTRACALPPDWIDAKPGSCGRPIRGVSLRIADERDGELPVGEVGEVLLRGPNVMQGYFKDPGLTSRTLRGGWLHTGDLGRVDEDGFLYLVGRARDLIKVAGERIGAREIEEVLAAHPGVVECAVTAAPHPVLGEVARAHVVAGRGQVSEDELRGWCAARLGHHKIPRSFVFLGELPKTASGKIQKHRLPDGPISA
jgi:long-chain acyl-CoA synthetase